jgi:hypothetical protein
MRESTGEWLRPLQERAERDLPPGVMVALLRQATIPAVEAEDSNFVKWAMENIPDARRRMRRIDWIEFGRLLRKKLEWWDYADSPSEDETQ